MAWARAAAVAPRGLLDHHPAAVRFVEAFNPGQDGVLLLLHGLFLVRAAPSLLVCPLLPPAATVYLEHRFGLGIREGCEVDLDGDFAPAFLTGQRQARLLPVVGVVV